jgi:methionyl aminopeptidase
VAIEDIGFVKMIHLKSDSEIDEMRESCRLAARALNMIEEHICPGISTLELNDICHDFIVKHGAKPAPLNYKGFPKSICTSINNVICHGIPNQKDVLKDGDIVNVDVTTILNGWHGDTSRTFLVGSSVKEKAKKLVRVAQECLDRGIAATRAGGRVGDIGAAIAEHAESFGFSVVREFVGHGIGKTFHEDPQISHFGQRGKGDRLVEGMVFTIEPMINEGHWKAKIRKDGWTAVTIDDGWSAQFEHTIAIRNDGTVEVLTVDA